MDTACTRDVLNAFPDAIVIVDMEGQIRVANQAACRLLKRTIDEIESSQLTGLIEEDKKKSFISRLRMWSTSRQPSPAKFNISIQEAFTSMHCLGSLFRRSTGASPTLIMIKLTKEQRRHGGFDALNKKIKELEKEIVDRRKYEKALVESETQVRLLLDSTGDAIFGIDLDNHCTFANKACLTTLGYSKMEDLLGADLFDSLFSSCGKNGTYREKILTAHVNGKVLTLNNVLFANSESLCFPVECAIYPIKHGELHLGSVVVFQDITEKKAIRDELSRSQKSLEQAQSIAHLGSWEWDLENNEMFWSEEVYRILQVDSEKFESSFNTFMSFIPEEERQDVRSLIANFAHQIDHELNIEHRITNSKGEERVVNQRGKTYLNEKGKPIKIFGSMQDITDKKRIEEEIRVLNTQLEERVAQRTTELETTNVALLESIEELRKTQNQLVESEKMAALGGLVAGIAHEINTPVGVGVTAASHLDQKLKRYRSKYHEGKLTVNDFEALMDSSENACGLVLDNLLRASNLISSFKKIAVDQTSDEPRELQLKEYIEEVISSLTPKIKQLAPQIEVVCDVDIWLYTHPGALSQIVTNFIMNSLIHGFDESFGKEGQRPIIEVNLVQNKDHVVLKYRDNGKGIAKEKCSKVFEPFFTTKRENGGSGLGMHIVYNLVTQTLGGNITLYSDIDEGVEFEITMPVKPVVKSETQKTA